MIVRTIQGDDATNELTMAAMNATIDTLVRDSVLTKEQSKTFLDTHLAMAIYKDGGFKSWWKRVMKKEDSGGFVSVVRID